MTSTNSSSVSTWFGDDDNNNRNETSLGIDWDDWDLDLWTPEQRQLLELGWIPRHVYIVLGVLLTFIELSLVSLPIPRFSTFFPGFDLFNFFV
jgi:hypothetical protein